MIGNWLAVILGTFAVAIWVYNIMKPSGESWMALLILAAVFITAVNLYALITYYIQ